MSDNSLLPSGWTSVPLSTAACINPGSYSMPPQEMDPVSFVPMAAVEEGTGRLDPTTHRSWSEVKRGYTPFQDGDVLFAKVTPCMENGKAALATGLAGGRGAGSTEFFVLRSTGLVDPKYLLQFILQTSFRRDARTAMQGAAGLLRVRKEFLESAQVPIAPLSEQRRIVAEIERQFTRLDAGTEALKRLQTHLKQYRASVLKAACEGKLVPTEAELARKEGRDYEPADKLLERILKERRAKWEADQLAKMKAAGKIPTDDKWKAKYEEPMRPAEQGSWQLPSGWAWATVDQLLSTAPRSLQSGPFGSNLHHSEFQETGVLAIGIDNVRNGEFSQGADHRISDEKFKELAKYSARPLDVLVTVMATVGRCCVVPADIEQAIITKHVYRISCEQRLVDPRFVMFAFLGAPLVLQQVYGEIKGQTRPGINGEILRRTVLPIPPIAEQVRIVAEVERLLSHLRQQQQLAEHSLVRASRLRQSILKRAFEGKLVPQDPTDEPASVLLERIRTSSTESAKPKATRVRPPKSKSKSAAAQ